MLTPLWKVKTVASVWVVRHVVQIKPGTECMRAATPSRDRKLPRRPIDLSCAGQSLLCEEDAKAM